MKEIDELIAKYENDCLECEKFIERYKKVVASWLEDGSYDWVPEEANSLVRLSDHIELLEEIIEDLKAIKEKTNK